LLLLFFLGAELAAQTWTGQGTGQNINRWSGGLDQIFFGSSNSGLTANQRSQIVFANYASRNMHLNSGEVVPIPEPATVFAGMALLGFAIFHGVRRVRRAKSLTQHVYPEGLPQVLQPLIFIQRGHWIIFTGKLRFQLWNSPQPISHRTTPGTQLRHSLAIATKASLRLMCVYPIHVN
jgi:hypothetical protein